MKLVAGGLPRVRTQMVVLLVVGAFLLGLYTGGDLDDEGDAADGSPTAPITRAGHRRDLTEASTATRSLVASNRPGLGFDPLDTPRLEQWMLNASGLLTVRPPVPAGRSGDDFLRVIPSQMLSWAPRLLLFPAFIDPQRCDALISMAAPLLKPSQLAGASRGGIPESRTAQQDAVEAEEAALEEQEAGGRRTSTGVFLSSARDGSGILAWLEERIAAATMLPASHGEPFNLLHYQPGQFYDSHLDAFRPAKDAAPGISQRIATVVVYLSDVEGGGETVFKREGEGGLARAVQDWRGCDDGQGFKYKPRRGDALLFFNTHPDGSLDEQALHGGCPVTAGEKWVLTKWIRNQPVQAIDSAAVLDEGGDHAAGDSSKGA